MCCSLSCLLSPPFLPSHSLTHSMVASDFAAAAVLITFGAVLGKASPFQMIIIAFFEIMFYSANEALNIHVLKAADIGGSMLIHTFGAYFGIAVSFALYKKKAWDHPKNSSVYHSDLFAMIGEFYVSTAWRVIAFTQFILATVGTVPIPLHFKKE